MIQESKVGETVNFVACKCMECGSVEELYMLEDVPDDAYLCPECETATYFCPDCMEVGSDCTCAYCQHCSNMEEDCNCPTCHDCGIVVYECGGCEEIEYSITDIYPTSEEDIPF